jgi:hypothetical protein
MINSKTLVVNQGLDDSLKVICKRFERADHGALALITQAPRLDLSTKSSSNSVKLVGNHLLLGSQLFFSSHDYLVRTIRAEAVREVPDPLGAKSVTI